MIQTRSGTLKTLALLILALALGAWAGSRWTDERQSDAARPDPAAAHRDGVSAHAGVVSGKLSDQKVLHVCPMHPDVIRDQPGSCPICGMALVPVADANAPAASGAGVAADAEADPPAVGISAAVSNSLGVRLATVTRRDILRRAILPAYVQGYTPDMTQAVRSHIAGTVARLKVRPGQRVRAGQLLFEIQVPHARETQKAHLELLPQGNAQALEASRAKLRELGMTGDDIRALESERRLTEAFEFNAQTDSTVSRVAYRSGDRIEAGETVLELQSPGATTVDVDIFQTEALWLQSGDRAELRVRQFPNRVWIGEVSLQGMRTNPEKRTYGLSLLFPMETAVLGNDMFGEVVVTGVRRQNVLAVPAEAVIRTEGKNRVIVALGDGRFRPVDVKPGAGDGRYIEILAGLNEGERVVVSSQFLIDSEASMRAEMQRLSADSDTPAHPATAPPAGHIHAGHVHE